MGLKSLFTNIPQGINAGAKALEKSKDMNILSRVSSLTLYLNNFSFNGKHFLQKKRSSMSNKSSYSYADIFVDGFETNHIYPRISNHTLAYFRLVDDIFMINISIRFHCKHSLKSINFLGTTVFKNNQ